MIAHEPLRFDSPPHHIMADLRQQIMTRATGFNTDSRKVEKVFYHQDFGFLAEANVFYFGRRLDLNQRKQTFDDKLKDIIAEYEPIVADGKLLLPFPQTVFIGQLTMNDDSRILIAIVMRQVNFSIELNFFWRNFAHKLRTWLWLGYSILKTTFGFGGFDLDAKPSAQTAGIYAQTVILGHALLNRKGNSAIIEPAQWELAVVPPGKLKNFQRPNPSVSVVKVGTPRLLHIVPDDATPTGATVRPHDWRSHPRHVGNRIIQVPSSKVNGGAPSPTAKIIKRTSEH